MLFVSDAVAERVRVDVREPEDRARGQDHDGHSPR
jgi:hypothetical protein